MARSWPRRAGTSYNDGGSVPDYRANPRASTRGALEERQRLAPLEVTDCLRDSEAHARTKLLTTQELLDGSEIGAGVDRHHPDVVGVGMVHLQDVIAENR